MGGGRKKPLELGGKVDIKLPLLEGGGWGLDVFVKNNYLHNFTQLFLLATIFLGKGRGAYVCIHVFLPFKSNHRDGRRIAEWDFFFRIFHFLSH